MTVRDKEFYKNLHQEAKGYQLNNWLISELDDILALNPTDIVELGCGNGQFLKKAYEKFPNLTGVDWVKAPGMDSVPTQIKFVQADIINDDLPKGDLICSADVLEHMPKDQIEIIIEKIINLGPKHYHVIACYDDNVSHDTILEPEEWLKLFNKFGKFQIHKLIERIKYQGYLPKPIVVITN